MKAHKPSVLALALAIVMVSISGCDFATSSSEQVEQNPGLKYIVTVVTEPFTLDSKYASMEGPSNLQDVYLLDTPKPELLWITAIEANIVDAANESNAMPPQLMCHTNLDLDVIKYPKVRDRYKQFGLRTTPRLFTLSQGQSSIKLSDGFGIPIRSDESLRLTTQVLNSYDEYIGSEIKQKITFTFVRESELTSPMKPLRFVSSFSRVSLEEVPAYYSLVSHKDFFPMTGAPVAGFPAVAKGVAADYSRTRKVGLGREYSSHWIVPPGRNEIHTVMNKLMGLTDDMDIHYIAAHLHPYATSIEISDMTTQSSVFQADVESSPDGKALTKIHNFSSIEPLTLYAHHDYELISIYENTSDEDVTAMALIQLYAALDNFDARQFMGHVSQ